VLASWLRPRLRTTPVLYLFVLKMRGVQPIPIRRCRLH
jgi:hypothetical protein